MERTDEILMDLFARLRAELRAERIVGLALKAQGPDITLRIRSERLAGDEKQPYFAVVVGERDGSFRISYRPSGVPAGHSQVSIIGPDSAEQLLALVREFIETERHRLTAYQQDR